MDLKINALFYKMQVFIILAVLLILFLFRKEIRNYFSFFIVQFLFKCAGLLCYFSSNTLDKSFKIDKILTYYDNNYHSLPNDIPVVVKTHMDLIYIYYSYNNTNYCYVHNNSNNSIETLLYFPYSSELNTIGPKGIISCELINGDLRTDITNLMLSYQGPLKDFHERPFQVKFIKHHLLNENSIIEILDTSFETKVFSYDDVISLQV